jgi:hypothetical protein
MAGDKNATILKTDSSGNLLWMNYTIWHSGNLSMSEYVKKTETMTRYANNEWRFLPTDYKTSSGTALNVLFNYKSVTGENLTVPITNYIFYNGAGVTCPVQASKFVVSGGRSSQFLKGDGSLDSKHYVSEENGGYINGSKPLKIGTSAGLYIDLYNAATPSVKTPARVFSKPTVSSIELISDDLPYDSIVFLYHNLRASRPISNILTTSLQERGLHLFSHYATSPTYNAAELYPLNSAANAIRLASLVNCNSNYVNNFHLNSNKWTSFFYMDMYASAKEVRFGSISQLSNTPGGYLKDVIDIYFTSDKRYKKNIEPYKVHKGLLDVKLKSYIQKQTEEHKIGYIAQEVQKVAPDFVQEDKNGYLSISYRELELAMIEALKQEVKQLRKELNHIKAQTKKNRL